MRSRVLALVLALAAGACGGDDDPSGAGGAGGGEACGEDVPVLSWETFAEGFLATYCQGCHASASPDRKGAPEDIVFDTEEDALKWKATILDVATSDMPRMPPAGGPSTEDRERLSLWLTCFTD